MSLRNSRPMSLRDSNWDLLYRGRPYTILLLAGTPGYYFLYDHTWEENSDDDYYRPPAEGDPGIVRMKKLDRQLNPVCALFVHAGEVATVLDFGELAIPALDLDHTVSTMIHEGIDTQNLICEKALGPYLMYESHCQQHCIFTNAYWSNKIVLALHGELVDICAGCPPYGYAKFAPEDLLGSYSDKFSLWESQINGMPNLVMAVIAAFGIYLSEFDNFIAAGGYSHPLRSGGKSFLQTIMSRLDGDVWYTALRNDVLAQL